MRNRMVKITSCTKGNAAESKVAAYLEKLGFEIKERNFYIHMIGEIDIIASKKDTIYFVEVKFRSNKKTFDIPDGCVSYKKLEKIKKCADLYLQRKNITDKYCKFIGALVHNPQENLIPEIKIIPFE